MVHPVDGYTRPKPPPSYMMREGSDQRFPIDPEVSRAEMERVIDRKARFENARDSIQIIVVFAFIMALFLYAL